MGNNRKDEKVTELYRIDNALHSQKDKTVRQELKKRQTELLREIERLDKKR